jgi:hypothetical protein
MKVTHEELLQILKFDEIGGKFTWLISPRANIPAGSVAGTIMKSGHVRIRIKSKFYLAHRLAWFYMTREWPPVDKIVEHADTVPGNNTWTNLRLANKQQNAANSKKHKSSTSGFKGVSWKKSSKKWAAKIRFSGKDYHLGYFKTPEAAHSAYCEAGKRFFGEFFNAG